MISIGTVVVRPWGIVGVVGALTAKSFLEMIIFARPCLRELG